MATVRLESFPFDSKFDGYDEEGYPVYDRAVGAGTLRAAFKQFFSDGVFGTPADAWKITKGDGLSVKVAPGTAVIRGGVASAADEVTLKLSDAAPQGRMTYSILLRLDDNVEYRSIYLVASEGEAGADTAPKVPQDDAGAKELRLGYVVVPSGATDLSGAEIVSEKGSSVCPYAAPFESIDVSTILDNLKAQSDEQYRVFLAYLQANYDLVSSVIDGTTAGYLQEQISQLKLTLPNTDFWAYVSGSTSSDEGDKHATVENIRYFRQKNEIKFLSNSEYISDVLSLEPKHPDFAVSVSNESAFFNRVPSLTNYGWADLAVLSAALTAENKADYYEKYKIFLGNTVSVPIAGYGTFDFEVVGVCHDVDASGKPLLFSFMPAKECIDATSMNSSSTTSGGWAASRMRSFLVSNIFNALPSDLQAAISAAHKANTPGYGADTDDKLWLASFTEVGLGASSSSAAEGTVYERFASASNEDRIRRHKSSTSRWWLRSVSNSSSFYYVNYDGYLDTAAASNGFYIVPGFCI